MRKSIITIGLGLVALGGWAQTGNEAFSFLRLPNSNRASAMGGHTVSLVENDPSLIFHNPGLLGTEMDGTINLNYLNYISDINAGSALFTKAHGEKGAWGVGASFFSYGDIQETTPDNTQLGKLSTKDISLQGFYARDLSERWRAGLSMKFLYSALADYSSIGLCFDAGLSYYNSETEFSYGFVLKNIGAQLKPFYDERQKMPWDIQMGFSKRMRHAPIRFSLTAQYLNRWKFQYVDDADNTYDGDSFFQAFVKHFVIGVDFIPSDNFWVGVGYNPKTALDMKLSGGGNGLAGLSAGAGIRIKMFDVGCSIAKYHPSALSMMISLSFRLADLKP